MPSSSLITAGSLLGALLVACTGSSAHRESDGYLFLVTTEGTGASWRGFEERDRVCLPSGRSLLLIRRRSEGWALGVDGLVLESADGDTKWRVGHERLPLSSQPYLVPGDCVTVLERGDRIITVSWNSVASGALVTLIDARNGEVFWQRPATALGGITHTRYLNQVTTAASDDAVVLWGREAGGEYLEVVGFDGQVRHHRLL